jgi:predicted phosphodiesterase
LSALSAIRVIAYARTHLPFVLTRALDDGSELFFVNPGSPTMPAEGPPTVAILDVRGEQPIAEIVEL